MLYTWVRQVLMLFGVMSAVLLAALPGVAAEQSDYLQIQLDDEVIYCVAHLHVDDSIFLLPMQDGVTVATEWHIQVARVRKYWLDEDIADIIVQRRVEPDLLTRSWLLIDVSSGISHRVYQIQHAIRFLSELKQFPVLDRSLLMLQTTYRAQVNVGIHIGVNDAWWTKLWKSAAASMQQDFSLP